MGGIDLFSLWNITKLSKCKSFKEMFFFFEKPKINVYKYDKFKINSVVLI